jgi:hypothetical protein
VVGGVTDGQFRNNKANWEDVSTCVANPYAAQFANWKIRPTRYSAAIEYMEGSSKSLTQRLELHGHRERPPRHDLAGRVEW